MVVVHEASAVAHILEEVITLAAGAYAHRSSTERTFGSPQREANA